MIDKVWVLFGTTGEYSDRSEWVVRGYLNEADAEADCAALNAIAKDIGGGRDWASLHEAVAERLTPHDASADMDYTGTEYSVSEVPIVASRTMPAPDPETK